MTTASLPSFKYHPDPVASGAVVASDATCTSCGQSRGFVYTGPVFTELDDVQEICPWCIADGRGAERFQAEFTDPGASEEVASKAAQEELGKRTPGYSAWQAPVWLEHCGDYCAYLGEPDAKTLKTLSKDLADDLHEIAELTDLEVEDILAGEADALGMYLFRCLQCGKHRLHWDFD